MKKAIVVFGFCLLALSINAQKNADPDNLISIGQAMPEFTVTTMDGEEFSSTDLEGKVVLINFFATWCGPCRAELPHVKTDIWDKYKDNDKFILLIISREEKPEKVTPFINNSHYPMTFYSDIDRSCYKQFAGKYIPRNYLFDKGGKLVYLSKGYNEVEFKHLLATIEKAVK